MSYTKSRTEVHDASRSALRRYQDIVIGSSSLWDTLKFELLTGLLGGLPGAPGLFLRAKLYPGLFRHVGRGVIFGRNISLLHPNRVSIGDNVIIADGVTLGGRGSGDESVTIGSNVTIGEGVRISTKYGRIVIGSNVDISHDTSIGSLQGVPIEIGDYSLIAAYTYIGGVSYRTERTDTPVALQGLNPKGGIRIGRHAWLGVRSIVLDGNSVGRDAIIGAGAVVTRDIPPFAIAVGVPASVVRIREGVDETQATEVADALVNVPSDGASRG